MLKLLKITSHLNAVHRNYSVLKLFKDPQLGSRIEIKGWIANIRKQKQFIFLDLNDGSTSQKLQVIIPSALNINVKELSAGSSVTASGSLVQSPKGDIELVAEKVNIITNCQAEGYPFAPRKQYAPEYIRQYLHLRPKTKKFSSLLRIRSAASFAFHSVFKEEGFINIQTPILTSNDCEGAGETFKVIPDSEHLIKTMAKPNESSDIVFFNKKTYLSVSGQLHLEAATNGLGKVYSFGPTFRAENSKSRLHLSEFYMIEAEIPFIEQLKPLLKFTEKLMKKVTVDILESNASDFKCFENFNEDDFHWLNKDFPILTYEEALQILEKNKEQFSEGTDPRKGIKKEHEVFLVKYVGGVPLFVIDWPKEDKPFYMKENENDSSKVSAFDLLAPGIGEIVGGSLRENNFNKLQQKLPAGADLDWYLELRQFGGVPTGGFGLGFERYLQSILKIDNIKDAIPFPRWPHNCSL